MDTTLFLAQLWGPVILAVGVGIFVSHNFYLRIYSDLGNNTLAVLVFGMAAMALGIAQINVHNIWDTLPQMVVSFLGWGLLVKGTLFIIAPAFVERVGNMWADKKLVPVAGTLTVVVGVYLSWISYFA